MYIYTLRIELHNTPTSDVRGNGTSFEKGHNWLLTASGTKTKPRGAGSQHHSPGTVIASLAEDFRWCARCLTSTIACGSRRTSRLSPPKCRMRAQWCTDQVHGCDSGYGCGDSTRRYSIHHQGDVKIEISRYRGPSHTPNRRKMQMIPPITHVFCRVPQIPTYPTNDYISQLDLRSTPCR